MTITNDIGPFHHSNQSTETKYQYVWECVYNLAFFGIVCHGILILDYITGDPWRTTPFEFRWKLEHL